MAYSAQTTVLKAAAVAFASALTLTACSAPQSEDTDGMAPVSTTSTPSSTASPTETTSSPSSSTSADATTRSSEETASEETSAQEPTSAAKEPTQQEQPANTQTAQTKDALYSDVLAQLETNGYAQGTAFTIDNNPVTLCTMGDGWGLNIIAVGQNTTCGFATNVVGAQTRGLNPTTDNIRDSLKSQVSAQSPTTGQTYTMNCATDSRLLITCTGGNNASVYLM